MQILETERLILRELEQADDAFILDILNQPSFLKYIGDRQVRDLEQARDFIENRYRQSYRDHGFGLYAVELKSETGNREVDVENRESELENPKPKTKNPVIGMCGFVKRDTLPDADIGFAFLPQFEKKGYAFEAAAAVLKYGRERLGLERVLAITTQDNEASGRLLGKLGFTFSGNVEQGEESLKLFSFGNIKNS